MNHYRECSLCPRHCGVDRMARSGFCGETSEIRVGRASLHYWEEPCVSGENGSGTVFFSGCSLRCCYCQNHKISRGSQGTIVDTEKLANIFLNLQEQNAHNINLVTAEHYAPSVKKAILDAKKKGLVIPIILNSSGYVSDEVLDILHDVVDVYLVDFKYLDSTTAKHYSLAEDYPSVAKRALEKMVSVKPKIIYDEEGIIQSGVIVRHLCLPGHKEESKRILRYVHENYESQVVLSIMSQYTPVNKDSRFENLLRKLIDEEYDEIIDFCLEIGVEDAFVQ